MKTVHGGFYQEPSRKTPQWKFVPCLEASSLFQSIADASYPSLLTKLLCGIFWSLLFLKLRASEEEEVPKPVPHYLYTQPVGFSVRKKQLCLSFWWCQCPFLQFAPKPTFFWRASGLLEGFWRYLGRLWAGCFSNLHLYMCGIVHVCTVLRSNFAPYTSNVHKCWGSILLCWDKDTLQVPIPAFVHLNQRHWS